MNVCMAGVDHTKAGLDIREAFAFTHASRAEALSSIKKLHPDFDAILIATCNRTELWLGSECKTELEPEKILCDLKKIPYGENKDIFTVRRDDDALQHIFYLTCGLKSQITGENQILSQVKEAVEAAAEAGSAGFILRRLFQSAVTCAKRVKTETQMMKQDRSASSVAVDFIKSRKSYMSGLNCLVIGNGVIGRLCAELLCNEGCRVTMTLRHHKYNKTVVQSQVSIINYDDRYGRIKDFDIIISATVSPHHTITYNDLSKYIDNSKRLFIDLAVPRDIDTKIKEISGVELYDIDELSRINSGVNHVNNNMETDKIKKIIDEEKLNFENWFSFRPNLDFIDTIKISAANDVLFRLDKEISRLALDDASKEKLRDIIAHNVEKVVSKMLFGLRDNLDSELWNVCFSAMEKSSQIESEEKKEWA
ncbi:glutamyl-tRNA reductase [Spirochaetia bacterium]|nr:glutamyl-tRNA reductase [Spirochaetia bacterium]